MTQELLEEAFCDLEISVLVIELQEHPVVVTHLAVGTFCLCSRSRRQSMTKGGRS